MGIQIRFERKSLCLLSLLDVGLKFGNPARVPVSHACLVRAMALPPHPLVDAVGLERIAVQREIFGVNVECRELVVERR